MNRKQVARLACRLAITLACLTAVQFGATETKAKEKKSTASNKAKASWVCNAYGRGSRGRWTTVSGTRHATENAARASVMKECNESLSSCQSTGCWND